MTKKLLYDRPLAVFITMDPYVKELSDRGERMCLAGTRARGLRCANRAKRERDYCHIHAKYFER